MANILAPLGVAVGCLATARWLVPRRPAAGALAAAAALAFPFTIPAEWLHARIAAAGYAIVIAAKVVELARGRVSDPRLLQRFSGFLFWLVVPPDAWLPEDAAQAQRNRRRGRARLLRGVGKGALAASLVVAHHAVPSWVHAHLLTTTLFDLGLLYAGLTGLADLVTGLAMQSGTFVAETFRAPFLARSPRDFWGRRWNRFIHGWAFRNLFVPLRRRGHPALATLMVFLSSGLLHEYLVWACLGRRSPYFGFMLLFFMLHGGATVLHDWLARRGRPFPAFLAVPAHLVWFVMTAPLFFLPLEAVFDGTWPAQLSLPGIG